MILFDQKTPLNPTSFNGSDARNTIFVITLANFKT
jgi:hypothetical protein